MSRFNPFSSGRNLKSIAATAKSISQKGPDAMFSTPQVKTIIHSLKDGGTGGGKFMKWMKSFGIGAGILGAGAYVGKETIIDPAVSRSRAKKSFRTLSQAVPQLADKDQKQVKDYFNVVKTFSPKAAGNPLVAGHLVNKMLEFGGVDHKIVQDIAAIESGFIRPTIAQAAAEGAAKSLVAFPGAK